MRSNNSGAFVLSDVLRSHELLHAQMSPLQYTFEMASAFRESDRTRSIISPFMTDHDKRHSSKRHK